MAFLADAQKPSFYEDADEMGFLVNFIFDDHDFKPVTQQLGWTLLDSDEIEAVDAFVDALEAALGPRSKPLSAITAAEWQPAALAAARAQAFLSLRGQPQYED